jgi:uncharacterized membrane protein affecting hemolysin expression
MASIIGVILTLWDKLRLGRQQMTPLMIKRGTSPSLISRRYDVAWKSDENILARR